MTGRPWSIHKTDFRVPVPHIEADNKNPEGPDTYLLASSSLSEISSEVMHRLYCSGNKVWSEVRRDIEILTVILARWKRDLPAHLDFEASSIDQRFISQVGRIRKEL